MGYKAGQGLGRAGTGITAPISQSSQMGRRGLGYSVGGLEKEDVKWEEEEVGWRSPPSLAPSLTPSHPPSLYTPPSPSLSLYTSISLPLFPLSLQVNIHQKVEWLQGPPQSVPNEVELDSWMVEGEVSGSCLPVTSD